jgi:tripartite-type tricarboxylate transporter receptor subunit TctC
MNVFGPRACAFAAALLPLAATAAADDFPTQPITIIVPFAAGGSSDQAARLAATKLQASLGQPVMVENKTGGNGQIAATAVKLAKPDGHTLMWVSVGTHAINPSLYAKLSYDPVKDFAPVIQTFKSTHFLLVPAASPAKNVNDVIAMARAAPGKLTFASVGIGSGSHLTGELFKSVAKIDAAHVPYRGSTAAIPDVVGGRVDYFFDGPTSAPLVKEGKMRALAVTDSKRAAVLPDVPTMAEAGYPAVELNSWFGIVAPAGTPKAVIARLNSEFNKAYRSPDVAQKIADMGGSVVGGTPEEFAAFMARETDRLGQLVKASGAKAE